MPSIGEADWGSNIFVQVICVHFKLFCLVCVSSIFIFFLLLGDASGTIRFLILFITLMNQYRWLSSKSSTGSNSKSTFEEKFLSQQSQNSGLSFNLISLLVLTFSFSSS